MRLSVERDYSILCLNLKYAFMNPKHDLVRQQRGDVLDTHWLEILIFLIGEQAEVSYTIFANASLMRNLVLHYSFHLKTPPWKL